jgi:hypothetical protein
MNRKINHHVSNHQVPSSAKASLIMFSPKCLTVHGNNLMSQLLKMSINFGNDVHGEITPVWCNSWKVHRDHLVPALKSIPRHFKTNQSTSLHIVFISHGDEGSLIWNHNTKIDTLEILDTLQSLQFSQLDSVSFLGCFSLKNVRIPKTTFDIIGFSSFFYWNEFPLFVARLMKEYFAGESLIDAAHQARKSCSVSKITPFPKNCLIVCKSNK